MFLSVSIIGCAILSILPHARCRSDGLGKGYARIKSRPDTEDMTTEDENFDFSGSNSNVNVNVNSNSNGPLELPWLQPQTYLTNHLPYGRGRRKTLNQIIPPIKLSPNSNVDFNFAHAGGNMRVTNKKRASRRKMSKKSQPSEDLELLAPSKGFTVCHPILVRTVEYLKRIETNMIDLEKELRTFLSALRAQKLDDRSQRRAAR